MRVRFTTTGNEGEVIDTTYLPSEEVGDLAGTWHHVRWDDGLRCWAHADSVETIVEAPKWEIVRRTQGPGTKVTVTAKSGPRVTTKEFLNEHQLAAFDWEADFQFALRKAQSSPRRLG